MKVIQLNAWCFNVGEDILDFVAQEKPDILNLQEVSTPDFKHFGQPVNQKPKVDYFESLKDKFDLQGIFRPSYGVHRQSDRIGYFGNGVLTKLPILDYSVQFDDGRSGVIVDEQHDIFAAEKATRVFGGWQLPVTLISMLLEYKGKMIKNWNTHFRATYKCTETYQTAQHTKWLIRNIQESKEMPTILSGDFNIHPESHSIRIIADYLEMVNKEGNNTLTSQTHPALTNGDLPDGVKVDYIFQKGWRVKSIKVPEVQISDHLPIVAEFDI